MIKNITLTLGFLGIWYLVGGFDWVTDTMQCIENINMELANQAKATQNLIESLQNEILQKNELINDYQSESLENMVKVNKLTKQWGFTKEQLAYTKEQLDLTKHSLNMANKALNRLKDEDLNDSSDYS